MTEFKGQITVSRDLRENKQVIYGKYDITDITFLTLGIGGAILLAYLLGFLFKVTDEFTAIIISIIPMIIILMLGFRKVAGMRYFDYLTLKFIDDKLKNRRNACSIYRVLDVERRKILANEKNRRNYLKDKFVLCFDIEKKYLQRIINESLSFENLSTFTYRIIKDKMTRKIIYRVAMLLKYENVNDIPIELYSIYGKRPYIKMIEPDRLKDIEQRIEKDKKFVYMLHLYDNRWYKKFINEISRYAEVVVYVKKIEKSRYINTFLVIDDNADIINEKNRRRKVKKYKTNIELVADIAHKYNIVLNKLSKEQGVARGAVSYYMFNTYNAYRKL